MKKGIGTKRTDCLARFVRSWGFVFAGLGLAGIYWLGEAVIHTFVLHEGSFLNGLSLGDSHELWTRLLIVCLFFALGSAVQWLMARRRRSEQKLLLQANKLGERVKELNCLYSISRLMQRTGVSLAEVLQSAVDLIPPSWQYPAITCARITLGEDQYVTSDFRETQWRQASSINVVGHVAGTTEVYYLEERPASDEGPFLKEERELIDGISRQIGKTIERKQMEEALRTSEEQFRTLVENANDGIYIRDAEGTIVYANGKFAEIHGYPLEEIIGRQAASFLSLESRGETSEQGVQEELRQGRAVRAEATCLRPSGDRRDLEISAVPIRLKAGTKGVVGIVRDITDRKEQARRKAEFMADVAHGVRTPLTSIKGYADLLLMKKDGATASEQQKYLSVISSNVDRLARLVDGLLDSERLESGLVPLAMQLTRLDEILRQEIVSIEVAARAKGLETDVSIEDGLWVDADSDRLAQLLSDLLSNAVKYTEQGSISVKALRREDTIAVSVHDTGIGIAPEDLDKIFTRFFRSEGHTYRDVEGTGLGLFIAKTIAERHGGRIDVESIQGSGSTFTLILPAGLTHTAED